MKDFHNILAVLQEDAQAPVLLKKLQRLSAAHEHDISLVRIVYEGLADLRSKHIEVSADLKELVLNAAQAALSDAVDATGYNLSELTCAAVWNARFWEGVIHASETAGAGLIVKPSDSNTATQGHLRTPDDWNLLRHAGLPVLLSRPRNWPAAPVVVAAVDVYDPDHEDLNARILWSASNLAEQLNGELHLASIFPVLSNWMDEITSMQSYMKLRQDVETEIYEELALFADQENVSHYYPHAVEGNAIDAMRNLIGLLGADLLVLGTKARKGISGIVLGNTAEKLMHAVDCDILTVP